MTEGDCSTLPGIWDLAVAAPTPIPLLTSHLRYSVRLPFPALPLLLPRYDGQVFVKPPEVLTRDRLLASYQVKPVLTKLRQTLLGAGVVLLTSAVLLGGLIQSGTDEDGVYGEQDTIALHNLQQRDDCRLTGSSGCWAEMAVWMSTTSCGGETPCEQQQAKHP